MASSEESSSPEASPRQTLSYLRNLLEERGIQPKTKLGQNFLIDLNVLDGVVQAAELSHEDLALEVGSGTGSLTARLADIAGAVLSIEIDPDFYRLVAEFLHGRENVQLLAGDVLRNKNEIRPEVFAAARAQRERFGCRRVKLVANLPYAVAVPVISNLLLSELDVERMVVMVQWEIAERLLAEPGSKSYGALAVLVQSLADVEAVKRRLPPAVFWPRPQVASAVLRIRPNAAKRRRVEEMAGSAARFRSFLRDLYVHRRKNLRGALAALPSGRTAKGEVDERLAALGLEGTVRAEALDREQHLRLCQVFAP